jgi:hypothetical protein
MIQNDRPLHVASSLGPRKVGAFTSSLVPRLLGGQWNIDNGRAHGDHSFELLMVPREVRIHQSTDEIEHRKGSNRIARHLAPQSPSHGDSVRTIGAATAF